MNARHSKAEGGTQQAASSARPILKWAGGKTRLLPELVKRVPPHVRYFEPFAGGLALFFALKPNHAALSDVNADLIATYRAVRDEVDGVIVKLEHHARCHSERWYYAVRDRWNANGYPSRETRAAAFLYLNRVCFNGLWRVNRAGAFNVPFGRYKNPTICNRDAILAASAALQGVDLRCGDYNAAIGEAQAGDFVYFDPPYDGTFTSYTAGGFGEAQQRELAETARELVARGCKVMLSNSDTPFVRSIYKGFRIDRVKCPRAINSNASKRGKVDEVIATCGY